MFNLSEQEVLRDLNSKLNGLTDKEVEDRIRRHGYNELIEEKRTSMFKIAFDQFKDPLVLILIIAALISGLVIRELLDSVVIIVIVILNATLGFAQEYKAEKSVALLKKLRPQYAKVIRKGVEKVVLARELVPGDITIIEAGDKAPADCRILEAASLRTDESALTGESVPVEKKTGRLDKSTPLAERTNMVYSGTVVSTGRAKAVVVATGMKTELGKISGLVQSVEEGPTPLQKRLAYLGKWLGMAVIIIAAVIFLIGILQKGLSGISLADMFMVALSLAVAAIPEGLPAVVTICLALGLRRMVKRNALVRKLKAVETLGSVTVICSDKTGTLTKNEMTVTDIFVNNKTIKVAGTGYKTEGGFFFGSKKINPEEFKLLLRIGASCNDSTLDIGDPTERALIVVAKKAGVEKEKDRINEIPFDSEKKFMATMHKSGVSFVKGAVEPVLKMCDYIWIDGRKRRLIARDKEKILNKNIEFAKNALRVLALAYKEGKDINSLCFVGLMGMIDPPREEVKEAIKICKEAGIRTVMITGDHKITAEAIGEIIGITGEVMTGNELDSITDEGLMEKVKTVSIFARTSSAHKVRILDALQKNGEIVAMTGDGVNDAPALKKADVGVAMNVKGTDVSREASDVILLDDNFATIVAAVNEGRVIYDNIKKFIKFLISANFGELLLIFFAVLFSLPLPLLPLQILWVNLVTDSLPALALGVDPPEGGVMKRKPRQPDESIFSRTKFFIIASGILFFLSSLLLFYFEYKTTGSLEKARTVTLTAVILFELFLVFSCRSEKSIFQIGFFSNPYVVGAIIIVIILQLLLIYSPFGVLFKLVPLSLGEWGYAILAGLSGFLFFEIKKMTQRNY